MNKTLIFLLIISFSGLSLAQPTPPHEVYGTVQHSGDFEELTVEALNDGELISSVTPEEDGYYSIKIPSSYETVEVGLETGEKHDVDVGSASVTELDFEASDQEEETASSGGSGGGGAAGGLGQMQDNSDPNNGTETVRANVENETVKAQVDEVSENETVQVQLPENNTESTLEEVSFTSDQKIDQEVNVEMENLGRETPEEIKKDQNSEASKDGGESGTDSGTDSGEDEVVYSYQRIDVQGVNDTEIKEAEINFEVNKSFLKERDRGPQEVIMERYNEKQWQELETRIDQEMEEKYRFKASSTGFSYYAVKLEETRKTEKINLEGLKVVNNNGNAKISLNVENKVNQTLNHTLTVDQNNKSIKKNITLKPFEKRNITLTKQLEPGNYTYKIPGNSKTVAISQEKPVEKKKHSEIPQNFIITVLTAITLLASLIYVKRQTIRQKIGNKDKSLENKK